MTVLRKSQYEFIVEDGNGKHHRVAAVAQGCEVHLQIDGFMVNATVDGERERLLKRYTSGETASGGSREVRAPMPSLVVAVEVVPGQGVKPGQGLIVLEAMKMENEVKANREGTVKSIHVKPGNSVEKGELLLEFER